MAKDNMKRWSKNPKASLTSVALRFRKTGDSTNMRRSLAIWIISLILLITGMTFSTNSKAEDYFDSSLFADRPGYTYDKFDKTWSYTGQNAYWVNPDKPDKKEAYCFFIKVIGDDNNKTIEIDFNVGCYETETYAITYRGKPNRIQFLFNDEVVINVQLPYRSTIYEIKNEKAKNNCGSLILGNMGFYLCKALSSFNSLSVKITFEDNDEVILHDFSEAEIPSFFAERDKTKSNDSIGLMCKKLLETNVFSYNTMRPAASITDDSKYITFENYELLATETSTENPTSTFMTAVTPTAAPVSESSNNGAFDEVSRRNGLFTYIIKGNGTVSIIDYDWGNSSGDIYIPSMLDGHSVTEIGDEAFANGKKENQTGILISIPNSITIIGEKAFYNSPISTISIPNSIKSIGKAAFAYCDITQFIVDQEQPNYATIDGALYDKRSRTLLAYPQKKTVSSRIPEGIQSIGEYAFSGMTIGYDGTPALCLTDLFPSTLNKIEAHAFENCTLYYSTNNYQSGIKYDNSNGSELALLPAGVTLVDEYAFAGCTFKSNSHSAPNAIVLAENLKEIGEAAFSNCRFYDGFEYDLIVSKSNMEKIGKNAFASSVMDPTENVKMQIRILLPEVIDEIAENAFFETYPVCIKGGTEIRTIGKETFRNTIVYSAIENEKHQDAVPTSLSIPGKVKTIPAMSFSYQLEDGLNSVEKIEIQEGVRKIEDLAFAGRKTLKTVILPTTLIEIGNQAFSGCVSIEEVSIPESVTEIGDSAFEKRYVTLIVKENSYAAVWASENGYNYRYEENQDTLDWLNSDIH